MRGLILIILSIIFSSSTTIKSPVVSCLQMDIILLGDFSGSVKGYEPFIAQAFNAFVKHFDVSENGVKIGVIAFGSMAEIICPLTSNEQLLQSKMDSLAFYKSNGVTNMYLGFIYAKNQFQLHGRAGFKKMIVLVSDGEPDLKTEVLIFGQKIKADNIGICSVMIVKKMIDDDAPMNYLGLPMNQINGAQFMQDISSDCYVESDYQNLIIELRKLDICL